MVVFEKGFYIFDVDGTIAKTKHRLSFIQTHPKNYDAFYAGVKNDPPILPVINVLRALKDAGYGIVIVSGRRGDDLTRSLTLEWFQEQGIDFDAIYMRKDNDKRPDDIVKKEILYQIREEIGEPIAVFDDRKRVIDMWISEGVFVFDVAQGQGDFECWDESRVSFVLCLVCGGRKGMEHMFW